MKAIKFEECVFLKILVKFSKYFGEFFLKRASVFISGEFSKFAKSQLSKEKLARASAFMP